ncbi:Synaptotagmin-3 [Zea mays]|uniref:Synaptotagmin-3 n=1 Tax=Zea mays TaxID=4577 RepID=A0A1D6GTR2_MAIZE|nr:Synaptotagmin-3 [Zea mays]
MGLVGGVVGFCLGLPIGLAAAYFVYLRYFAAARRLQDPVIKPLRDLDSETLQATIPHIPLWVKSPDYERVSTYFLIDWMNKFIFDMWPFLDKAICKHINRATRPIFDQYVGQYGIESIEFGELTLGTLPPTFQGIKVYEMLEKELVIEPVIRWASTSNVTVNVKVQSFEVTVQLEDLHIMLTPRVILKSLVPSFPCFANLCVSLMEKPRIDFGLKLLCGDVMAIPGLYQYVQVTAPLAFPFLLQDQLSKQISNLYHWPKVIQIPILDGAR